MLHYNNNRSVMSVFHVSSDTGSLEEVEYVGWDKKRESAIVFLFPFSFLTVFLQCNSQMMNT